MDKDQLIENKNNESTPDNQPIQSKLIQNRSQNLLEVTTVESAEITQPVVNSQQPIQQISQSGSTEAPAVPFVTENKTTVEDNNTSTPGPQNQQQNTVSPSKKAKSTPLIISVVVILLVIVSALIYLLIFANHKDSLSILNKQLVSDDEPLNSPKVSNDQKVNPIQSLASATANSYIASDPNNVKNGWKQVSVGKKASCGISFDDKLYCWGGSLYGTFEADLGVSRELDKSTRPVAVILSNGLDDEKIEKVVNGYGGSCVTTESGKLYCWGYNSSWGYGGWPKTFEGTVTPFVFDGGGVFKDKKISDVFLNSDGGCAISSDSVIYCWGYTNSSQDTNKPIEINTSGLLKDKTITSVESRASTTCAVTDDQKIYCWYNFSGNTVQSNEKIQSLTPIEIDTSGKLAGQKISKLSIGRDSVCVLTQSSNVYCWGSGSSGELGDGKKSTSKQLVQVTNSGVLKGVKIVSITSGESHSCVLSDAGKIYCWGDNYYGQLGDGTTNDSSVPIAVKTEGVLSAKRFVSVISYSDYTCAIDSDYQLYCWGYKPDVEYSKNIDDMMNKVPVKMF